MICPFCKEEIMDGAVKCKHCSSMLDGVSSASTVQEQQTDDSDKQKGERDLRALFEGKEYKVILGVPVFKNFKDQWKACWWIGLPAPPFNIFAYLFRGLIKRTILLLAFWICIWGVAQITTPNPLLIKNR
ncbi:hypothetical protein [Desulfovibrio cuneatus]|uniref:hypothetical protein n=1 Tax=Desulfovibrio cuneatus TaxID=159728 RepID=UPI0004867636|nr:hypothetical protein [Desulfovibrio cuneatus]